MKFRLEENNVCFRISREEMDALIKDGIIESSTMGLAYSVKLDGSIAETSLSYDNNRFTLTLTPQAVIAHKEVLPSKEGIVEKIELDNGDIVKISLEVDVRSRRYK